MKQDILNKYLPIIKRHYTDCKTDDIQLLDDGHDHYVFVFRQIHALRFPRTDAHGVQDHVVSVFSQKFAPLSPVPVQKITGHIDPDTGIKYQAYEFIPGITLSRELASTLTGEELISIAKDMGKFLSSLHSFAVDEAKSMDIESLKNPHDYGEYFKDFLEKDRKAFFSMLSKKEKEWIELSVEEFYNLTKSHPFTFTVTHSDMLPEHILIDQNSHKLTGIIDFSLRIADPANDFKYFDKYGEAFLIAVYENYLPVDEYFDKRQKFYAGNLPVANLYQSIERKDEKMIQEKYLKELKEYIASHPLE